MTNRAPPMGTGGSAPTRVLVLDDLAIVREGVHRLVEDAPDMELVGEGTVRDDPLRLVRESAPHVVLTDVGGERDPRLDLLRQMVSRHPAVQILVFTSRDDQDLLWEALDAGARGFVLKDVGGGYLVDAIRRVAGGQSSVDERVAPGLLRQLSRPRAHGPLSDREREILQMLADGGSNRDVSERLVVSVETVKTHVKHILAKLDAKHRTQAVAIGLRRNLIR